MARVRPALDVRQRAHLVTDLVTNLPLAAPGSEVIFRGSLADGRADRYSDIDLLWEVDDIDFASTIARLPAILANIRPVASLRFDPDFQNSGKRRLAFVRFAGVPLFWRVDLDIFARSVRRDDAFDRHNPEARGTSWSTTESALANAVAAIKMHLRGRDETAAALLARAEQRMGMRDPESGLRDRIVLLTETAAKHDPRVAALAADIRQLADDAF